MGNTSTFRPLMQMVQMWRIKRARHPNCLWKIIPIATEAVQELALTSMPLVRHKLLYRQPGQTWFDLPSDFTEVVSVGIRYRGYWRQVGISTSMVGMARFADDGDLDPEDFGAGFDHGAQLSWWGGTDATAADFNPADFSPADFLAIGTPAGADASYWGHERHQDSVYINRNEGQIMTGPGFPGAELYLVYVGLGSADTMTQIPVIANAAIEAYIDWKYMQYKRGGLQESGALRQEFFKQHKILRARLNRLSVQDIKDVIESTWYRRRGFGSTHDGGGQPTQVQTQVITLREFDIIASGTTNVLTHNDLAGVNVSRITYGGQSYNAAFFTKNVADNFLTLTTPGVTFYPGLIVTITPK